MYRIVYGHAYRCVCIHVHRHSPVRHAGAARVPFCMDVRFDMCIAMCTDMGVGVGVDMCIDMCMDMCMV